MSMDPATDYTVWDNRESIHYEARTRVFAPSESTFSSDGKMIHVTDCKRRALSIRERGASNGVYTGQDLVWLVPRAVADGCLSPQVGDSVHDLVDGRRWTVLEVGYNTWRTWWRLVCRDLVLHHQLRDLVVIERATIEFDAAGAKVKKFPTGNGPLGGGNLYEGLRARVQPSSQEAVEERGIMGFRTRYEVIVEKEIEVDHEDRILWQGRYLEIVGYRRAEQVDELPIVEAELVP